MTITHRIAIREDLAQIVEIYNSTIPSRLVTADTTPVSVESRIPWFEEHNPALRPLWVSEVENNVVAWLSFSDFYGRPAYSRSAELSLYVHEQFRKKGLDSGSYLLAQAIPRHRPSRLIPFLVLSLLTMIRASLSSGPSVFRVGVSCRASR